MSNLKPSSVLVNAWYAQALAPFGAGCIDATVRQRFPAVLVRLASRFGWLQGALWFMVSRRASRVVCPFSARALPMFLLLHRLLSTHPPQLYLVEFLRPDPQGWRLKEWLHVQFFRRLLPRMLAGAQVMTRWEADAYARKYRLPPSRFSFIAFPMVRHLQDRPPEAPLALHGVLASGRAACDWVTLMAAARGTRWPLTIVCSSEDRPQVDALNGDGRARVMSEISHEEHEQLLASAAVYALVLREQRASSGQVRLARAIEAGVPVVATQVTGLDGYVEPDTTALAVPVGDAQALRIAIDALWNDPGLRNRLRSTAHAAMRSRSLDAYVHQIQAFALAPPSTIS